MKEIEKINDDEGRKRRKENRIKSNKFLINGSILQNVQQNKGMKFNTKNSEELRRVRRKVKRKK